MKTDMINFLVALILIIAIIFLMFYDPVEAPGIDFDHAKAELYHADSGYLREINEVEGTYETTCDCCHNNN